MDAAGAHAILSPFDHQHVAVARLANDSSVLEISTVDRVKNVRAATEAEIDIASNQPVDLVPRNIDAPMGGVQPPGDALEGFRSGSLNAVLASDGERFQV